MAGETKRYNLVLPMETFEQVKQVAETRQVTVAHVLRTFIKLGLTVEENGPDTVLVVRRGESERELVLL